MRCCPTPIWTRAEPCVHPNDEACLIPIDKPADKRRPWTAVASNGTVTAKNTGRRPLATIGTEINVDCVLHNSLSQNGEDMLLLPALLGIVKDERKANGVRAGTFVELVSSHWGSNPRLHGRGASG